MTTYKDAVGTNIGENVLLGKTPTFSGWNVDPSVNIDRLTDGSLATSMTSGSKDVGAGGWDYAYIDFDVANGIYIVGGRGQLVCAAANAYVYIKTSTGIAPLDASTGDYGDGFFSPVVVMVNDGVIRFGCTADGGAATVTPDLYELWAIRLA